MGTRPELLGILLPNGSGQVHIRRPAVRVFRPERGPAAEPDGKKSFREMFGSRLVRRLLPAYFGMGAHDGGISLFLGFFS